MMRINVRCTGYRFSLRSKLPLHLIIVLLLHHLLVTDVTQALAEMITLKAVKGIMGGARPVNRSDPPMKKMTENVSVHTAEVSTHPPAITVVETQDNVHGTV